MNRLALALVLTAALAGCADESGTSAAPTSTSTTAVPVAELVACPTYKSTTNVGTVKDRELDELSGLAKSAKNPDTLWTHNDSGDSARVFAIHTTGRVAGTYNLRDVNTFDAEDIAVSPAEPHDVWLADTGDNFHFRQTVQLYRFAEPSVTDGTLADIDATELDVKFQKPDGKGHMSIDSEAFFIDRSGNGYLVEKTKDVRSAWVFQISADDMRSTGTATAKPIVQITGNSSGRGVGPTGADLSADGTTLAVKNYSETFVWKFTPESSIAAVLQKQPTATCTVKAGLGEAITFDGPALLTVEEGSGKPIRKTEPR
jgi:hypothetical protein